MPAHDKILKITGERLRLARQATKTDPQEIADVLERNVGTVYSMERGKSGITIPTLVILHERFGLNPNYIILGKGAITLGGETPLEIEPIAVNDPHAEYGKQLPNELITTIEELRKQLAHHREINGYLMQRCMQLEKEAGNV